MAKEKMPQTERKKQNEGARYVRLETMLIGVLVALVIGFIAGEIINLSEPDAPVSRGGAPASGPHSQPTADQPVSPEQMARMLELEQQVSLNPRNPATWTELGNLYFDANQYDKAIEAYSKSLSLSPDNANVWTDMGIMYRSKGQPADALAAFEKAITTDPRHEQSRFNKGVVLMFDLHDNEGAIKAWEELLAVNPSATASTGEPIRELIQRAKENLGRQQP